MVKSPMFVAAREQRSSSGSPLQGSLPEMQRPSPPVLLGPSPRRHHQRPSHQPLCGVQSSSHAFPASLNPSRYLKYRRSKIRQPGRKSVDALSPKRTGPCKCYPRRYHVSRPSLPLLLVSLGHLVIWTFPMACPVLYTPAAWPLQPLHASSKITTRCRYPDCWVCVVPTPRPRYHTPRNARVGTP